MDRRQFLWTGAATLLTGAARASAPRPKSLIVVYAHGGWDPTYTFDPKVGTAISGPQDDPGDPGNPEDVEDVVSYGELLVAVNPVKRPHVGAFFDRWSRQTLAVNGLWAGGIAHLPNTRRALGGSVDRDQPDAVGVVAGLADPTLPFGGIDLSGYCRPGPFGTDLGRLGDGWQLGSMLDPDGELGLPDDAAGERVRAYQRSRAARLASGSSAPRWFDERERAAVRREALLARRGDLLQLLEGRSPRSSNDNLLLAADLVTNDLCRSVMVDSQQSFDTHANNVDQHPRNDELFEGLDVLLGQLDATGALDSTLVVVASEMVRAPVRNGSNGKHHWPGLSYLLLGGGISGGRVIGATDDSYAPVPMDVRAGGLDPVHGEVARYDHLVAGVLQWMDVDPGPWLPGVAPLGGFGRS
jgi:hypothetical protein